MREKDALSTIPLTTDDDFKYASDVEELGSTDEVFSGSEG